MQRIISGDFLASNMFIRMLEQHDGHPRGMPIPQAEFKSSPCPFGTLWHKKIHKNN